jgi:hypothetical protein
LYAEDGKPIEKIRFDLTLDFRNGREKKARDKRHGDRV